MTERRSGGFDRWPEDQAGGSGADPGNLVGSARSESASRSVWSDDASRPGPWEGFGKVISARILEQLKGTGGHLPAISPATIRAIQDLHQADSPHENQVPQALTLAVAGPGQPGLGREPQSSASGLDHDPLERGTTPESFPIGPSTRAFGARAASDDVTISASGRDAPRGLAPSDSGGERDRSLESLVEGRVPNQDVFELAGVLEMGPEARDGTSRGVSGLRSGLTGSGYGNEPDAGMGGPFAIGYDPGRAIGDYAPEVPSRGEALDAKIGPPSSPDGGNPAGIPGGSSGEIAGMIRLLQQLIDEVRKGRRDFLPPASREVYPAR